MAFDSVRVIVVLDRNFVLDARCDDGCESRQLFNAIPSSVVSPLPADPAGPRSAASGTHRVPTPPGLVCRVPLRCVRAETPAHTCCRVVGYSRFHSGTAQHSQATGRRPTDECGTRGVRRLWYLPAAPLNARPLNNAPRLPWVGTIAAPVQPALRSR